jgi:phosphodiesterase/alkaline phosphatase D-like protein
MHAASALTKFIAWDGYQAQRQRILQHAHDKEWNNTYIGKLMYLP